MTHHGTVINLRSIKIQLIIQEKTSIVSIIVKIVHTKSPRGNTLIIVTAEFEEDALY